VVRRDGAGLATPPRHLAACKCGGTRGRARLAGGGGTPALRASTPARCPLRQTQRCHPGIICAPIEGQSWWDVCAGSGGKSLHLLDLARGQLDLLATDTRDKALKELQRRQQGRRFAFRNLNAETDALPDTPFDGVLVDAPCSGFGTWARNPDARWRTDSDDITHLAGVQTLILGRASTTVKPGGVLVYSVCTLTRAETSGVVTAFLSDHPDFKPEPFVNPLDGASCDGTLLLPPERASGDGMYIARFRRR
jgi:16S rRNA (cytosine967-C5)-methyltransferase